MNSVIMYEQTPSSTAFRVSNNMIILSMHAQQGSGLSIYMSACLCMDKNKKNLGALGLQKSLRY